MSSLPLVVAFVAGIVSFLSPCVLPIIPGFLAYLGGESSAASGGQAPKSRWPVFLSSFFFVLGFSIVFAVLGVLLNGILAHAAYSVQAWLSRIGGALIIFFGLYLMGLFKIPFLEREHAMRPGLTFHSRYLTSFFFGLAFAAGWTPCVGPVLGGILGLAASAPGQAFFLLLSYSLGLGLPFLAVGFFVAQASGFIRRYAAVVRYVTPVFGFLLVALGVLVFTQEISLIANFDFINNLFLH